MRALMIGVVAVALAAAGGASFFANRLLTMSTQTAAEAAKPAPVVAPQVLVAAQDVPPGGTVSDTVFRWQPWPADALRPEYAAVTPEAEDPATARTEAEKRFVNLLARRAIAAGEPLTDDKVFSRDGAGFLAGTLAPGHRAVSLAVEAESAASGFILPGDRVDVILSQDARRHIDRDTPQARPGDIPVVRFTAETVAENIRVLAIDQAMQTEEKQAALVAKTVTLEVTPEQAELLAIAQQMGRISLTLRSLEVAPVQMADTAGDVPVVGRAAAKAWSGDLQVSPSLAALLRQTEPPAPEEPAAAPPPKPWKVTVFRAGVGDSVVNGQPPETKAPPQAAADDGDTVHLDLAIPETTLREEPGSLRGVTGTLRGPGVPGTSIRYDLSR